jgi:hypothetical protein
MRDGSITGGGDAPRPKVLVLTPVKNAAQHLDRYLELLQAVRHPRARLSLGLLDSDSEDGTFDRLLELKPHLAARCRRVHISQHDFGFRMPKGVARWAPDYQFLRRSVLARSRNHLLFRALDDEDWVLWIDVDVIDYPIDIIDTLLASKLDIVQPHCVLKRGGATFDLNAWIDKGAKHMQDLRDMKGAVRLDAVGGTMLLVRADLHRDGLIFPPFRYGLESPCIRAGGEIETEGFGILAKDMGLQCWGLPHVEIVHAPY